MNQTFLIVGAVLVVIIGLLLWRNDSLSETVTEYKAANESQAEALRVLSEASARQLAALERSAAEERERAKKHNQILQDIGSSNEEIKCPVPDFVRGAFERM